MQAGAAPGARDSLRLQEAAPLALHRRAGPKPKVTMK